MLYWMVASQLVRYANTGSWHCKFCSTTHTWRDPKICRPAVHNSSVLLWLHKNLKATFENIAINEIKLYCSKLYPVNNTSSSEDFLEIIFILIIIDNYFIWLTKTSGLSVALWWAKDRREYNYTCPWYILVWCTADHSEEMYLQFKDFCKVRAEAHFCSTNSS